jgi:hypothetical protein
MEMVAAIAMVATDILGLEINILLFEDET